jgi:copper chaperone CopZ
MFKKLMLLAGMLALGVAPVAAQASGSAASGSGDPVADVVLRVDGLACPFCAAGLEKKLEALDATDRVDVQLDDGQVFIFLKANQTVSDEELTEAVKHAGFALREIHRRETVPQA